MEWTIKDSDITAKDPSGVEGFIQRMDQELRAGGPPLEGFRFLNSGAEMLRITREIENEALENLDRPVLYVGFQTAAKLAKETSRYQRIANAGITAVGFGTGEAEADSAQVLEQWVNLPLNTKAFENQWYLVVERPTPVVFIGWETSAPDVFGEGGIASPGKQFKGFVSSDPRAVRAVIGHLEKVRRQSGPVEAMSLDTLSEEIPFPVRRMVVLTDDGQNPAITEMRGEATKFAARKSASVLLYDISAASYLTSPYPSEEYEREWNRPIDSKELGMIGRQYLVDQLDSLESVGISGAVILPTGHGFAQLAQRAEKENVDLIMIPHALVRPGLMERIKGYSLKTLLDSTSIPVMVYKDRDSSWLRTKSTSKPRRVAASPSVS